MRTKWVKNPTILLLSEYIRYVVNVLMFLQTKNLKKGVTANLQQYNKMSLLRFN